MNGPEFHLALEIHCLVAQQVIKDHVLVWATRSDLHAQLSSYFSGLSLLSLTGCCSTYEMMKINIFQVHAWGYKTII